MAGINVVTLEDVLIAAIIPVKIYSNSQSLRKDILAENKGKLGVYRWINHINGKFYIGSSMSLGRRLLNYYRPSYLRSTNTIISKALLKHSHSNFSLEILEYFTYDDSLTRKENAKLLLEREQHFLDLLNPEYNVLKTAGNLSGYKHSPEAIEKMSESKKGFNHPNFGNHLEFAHSEEAKNKIRLARTGTKLSRETIVKISNSWTENRRKLVAAAAQKANGITIFLYSPDLVLLQTFISSRVAAKYLNSSKDTVLKFARSNAVFKNKFILSLQELPAKP